MKKQQISGYQPKHFSLFVEDGVACVTLNRPDRKNPLTFDSYLELGDFFRSLYYADDVKSVVITGAGGNFCSGGDVHEIIGPLLDMDTTRLLDFTRMTGDLVLAMRRCPQPIIAAVEGICAGAGAIIAMASDIRIGTAESKTAFLFVRVGLAGCDMGACAILPRIIGHGRASELLFTGRSMDGNEARETGFFNRVVPQGDALVKAMSLGKELAAGPTFAHGLTKKMLHHEWDLSIDAAIESEAQTQALAMHTRDFRRAYEAFVEKKRPVFQGN